MRMLKNNTTFVKKQHSTRACISIVSREVRICKCILMYLDDTSRYDQDTCRVHRNTSGYVSDRNPPKKDRKPPVTPAKSFGTSCRTEVGATLACHGSARSCAPDYQSEAKASSTVVARREAPACPRFPPQPSSRCFAGQRSTVPRLPDQTLNSYDSGSF